MTFEMIKRNYDRKLWNGEMVKKAVEKRVISSHEYQVITGEEYVEAGL